MIFWKLSQIVIYTYILATQLPLIYYLLEMENLQMYVIALLIINYQFIFGKDKTKCTVLGRSKNLSEPNITYNSNKIKQHNMVQYFGRCLDANLSEEFMTLKSFRRTNLN